MTPSGPIRSFVAELRRRRVFRVAALYAAVMWATIEVASTILPRLQLPDWTVTLVVVLALFGFPLAIVLAWAFDVTRDGVRRTAADAPGRGSTTLAPPVLLLVVVGIFVAVGFSVRSLRNGQAVSAQPPMTEIRAIAVLPFENAGAGDDVYLSEGIAEELLHRLARLSDLSVAARTSSFSFRESQVDVREIGAKLSVDAVLEGSVRRMGEQLRISARLVSTRDGYQLWSETYQRESSDIFRLQDEISTAIVERLRPQVGAAGGTAMAEPESYEAFELYLKGRFEWNRRTEEGLRAAVRYLEQAVARAPTNARMHLGLADAAAVMGFYDYTPPSQAFASARKAATRALELDPDLTEAHATLAYVSLYHDYDFDAAERTFRRAIELNPRYAVAHQWYGNLLAADGRFDEALREMMMAQQLDPLALIGHAAEGFIRMYSRDYDRAITQLRGTLQRDSTYFLAHLWLGQALDLSGNTDEAVDVLRGAVRRAPHSVLAEAALARALALHGAVDEARRIVTGLEARSSREYVASYDIALVHIALGDVDAALSRLERAYDDRAHALAFVDIDPRLDALRGQPRFERLRQRIGRV